MKIVFRQGADGTLWYVRKLSDWDEYRYFVSKDKEMAGVFTNREAYIIKFILNKAYDNLVFVDEGKQT